MYSVIDRHTLQVLQKLPGSFNHRLEKKQADEFITSVRSCLPVAYKNLRKFINTFIIHR